MLRFGIYKVDITDPPIKPPKKISGDSKKIIKNNSDYIDYIVAYTKTLKETREKKELIVKLII